MMRRARGFSLLELVVVLGIFAVVALIGVQVIQATLLVDQRLRSINDETAELALGLALLRQDLNAAVAMPFYPPGGAAEPALDAASGRDGFSLSIGGLADIGTNPHDGFGRVEWRLDPGSGRLLRRVWPSLIPGDRRVAGAEIAVLHDVRALEIESFESRTG